MQTPAPKHPAIPRLNQRHCAMLQEMGVPVWWPAHDDPPPIPPTNQPANRPANRPVAEVPPASAAPRKAVPTTSPALPAPERTPPAAVAPPPLLRTAAPEHPATAGLPDLEALQAAVQACTRCHLAQGRLCAVPGSGDSRPDWLIVGEAPGEEEDRQGQPFVGPAGQLLDRMLAAMQLARAQKVYIANVIKCRPPMNRNPSPQEIAACSPYLLRQVALLQPRLIVAMGRFAALTLLTEGGALTAEQARQLPLGKLRGRVHTVHVCGLSLPLVATYHPAYLLRSPAEKGKAWADLCLAMDTMERAAAGQRA
jgi:DNA polymerase